MSRPTPTTCADPLIPLRGGEFRAVARRGIDDDAGNSYPHAMCWFRDHLFVATTRHLGAVPRLRAKPSLDPVEVHHVRKTPIHFEMDHRSRIFRFDPATGEWRCLYVAPWCMGDRGFQIARVIGFRAATVYQSPQDDEPALYFTGWGTTMGPGPFLFRSTDGEQFEELVMEHPLVAKQTLRALTPFKGRLFTVPSPQGGGLQKGLYSNLAAVVYVCTDPVRGDWEIANPLNFGDPRNFSVASLAVFNDHLYAGTMNPYSGFEVWKTDAEGTPPYHWTKVIDRGAHRGNHNEVAGTMFGFKDHLYIGSMVIGGGIDPIFAIGPAAVELVRVAADDSWELVMGDARYTPDGFAAPISGFLAGFNNAFSGYLWAMAEYGGCLYASTMTWVPWLRYLRKDLLPQRIRQILTRDMEETLFEALGGFALWASADGASWSPVTTNGFNNPYSLGARNLVPTPYGLFVGTGSQFGPDSAVRRLAGWRFEMNTRAGMEIWLGSRPPYEREPVVRERANPALPVIGRRQPPVASDLPLVDAFYGNTPWRLHGFWAPHVRDPVSACENLMAELLAFVSPEIPAGMPVYPTEEEIAAWAREKGTEAASRAVADPPDHRMHVHALDVRCAYGATTRWLSEFYPEELLQGVASSRSRLKQARRLHPHLSFIHARLPRLPRPTASVDHLFCVEGPSRCGALDAVFTEFFRVLRPGGTAVFADFLGVSHPAVASGAYRAALERSGFTTIRLHDVSDRCLEPFCARRRAFLQEKTMDGRHESEELARVREALHETPSPPVVYRIGAATRPHPDAP
jgi:SAM-dependent methyltransferase